METASLASLNNYMDLLLDAICIVDRAGRFVFVSAGCERIFGYTPEEMIGTPMLDLVHPDDRTTTLLAAAEIMDGQSQPHFENRYIRKDGGIVDIMWSARWSEPDQVRVAVARDITIRKRAQARQAAMYAISDAAQATDDLHDMFLRIQEATRDLVPTVDLSVVLRELEAGASGDWRDRPGPFRDGAVDVLVAHPVPDRVHPGESDPELLHFVSTQVAAAIERKQILARLKHLALYDPLTQLPNRELFSDRIGTVLLRARRDSCRFSLLFLDLDGFKAVNDTLGHATGDRLLAEVAARIKLCVRESDTVTRFGGDEFVVLLENCAEAADAVVIAEMIRSALGQPFDLDGQPITVQASIGVTTFPQHGDDVGQLLSSADQAMYVVKKRGGNGVHVSDTRLGDGRAGGVPGLGDADSNRLPKS